MVGIFDERWLPLGSELDIGIICRNIFSMGVVGSNSRGTRIVKFVDFWKEVDVRV